MTMKRLAVSMVFLPALCLPALAALPPEYQRQAELQAVLERATEVFGPSRLIEAITYGDVDLYRVTVGGCTLEVRIVDTPSEHLEGFAGPRQFEAQAGEPVCP